MTNGYDANKSAIVEFILFHRYFQNLSTYFVNNKYNN
jgi:hypothetical protein